MMSLVPATAAHVADLAHRLRPADRAEFDAEGLSPLFGLQAVRDLSPEATTALVSGRAEAMFGICNVSVLTVVLAMLFVGSNAVTRHARLMVAHNRRWLVEAMRPFRVLRNRVDARNRVAIRWLRWLGFTILPPEPHGPHGLPFHPYEMEVA